jgi:hypothetical protein
MIILLSLIHIYEERNESVALICELKNINSFPDNNPCNFFVAIVNICIIIIRINQIDNDDIRSYSSSDIQLLYHKNIAGHIQ